MFRSTRNADSQYFQGFMAMDKDLRIGIILATEWSQLKAKVPELAKGTRWTLHTLKTVAIA